MEADIIQEDHAGDAELAFLAEFPPLAYATFSVHPSSSSSNHVAARSVVSSR